MLMAILLVTVFVLEELTAVETSMVPVVAGSVAVFVPAVAGGEIVMPPEVAPLRTKLPIRLLLDVYIHDWQNFHEQRV